MISGHTQYIYYMESTGTFDNYGFNTIYEFSIFIASFHGSYISCTQLHAHAVWWAE